MNNDLTQTALDNEKAMYEEAVERGKKLIKLYDNKEFKELILEDYLKDKALQAVGLLAHPAISANPEASHRTLSELKAISTLQQYFISIERDAGEAMDNIETLIQEAEEE